MHLYRGGVYIHTYIYLTYIHIYKATISAMRIEKITSLSKYSYY